MSFEKNVKGERPSTHWNIVDVPLTRVLTPLHDGHYDIQYEDSSGKVQARMDGLTPMQVHILKTTGSL